jgi:hypothetical protein
MGHPPAVQINLLQLIGWLLPSLGCQKEEGLLTITDRVQGRDRHQPAWKPSDGMSWVIPIKRLTFPKFNNSNPSHHHDNFCKDSEKAPSQPSR